MTEVEGMEEMLCIKGQRQNVVFLYTSDCSLGISCLCCTIFGDYHISDNVCLSRKQNGDSKTLKK